MKKIIRVQLDFGVNPRHHTLYNSLIENPPEGIIYEKSSFVGVNNKTYSSLGKIRKFILKIFPYFERLDRFVVSLMRKESNSDIVHFALHFGKTKKICVADYEHAYNFIYTDNKESKTERGKAMELLKLGNVKHLMPIHEEAKKSFEIVFGKEIKIPQTVLYPTIKINNEKIKSKKKNKAIFIGSANITSDKAFAIKGGYETTIAFNSLAKKYKDYEFIIISNIPQNFLNKKEENVKIFGIMSQNELWKVMSECSIFVQPNYHTPAMAFLEAMKFGIPIITYDCWANKEYVDKNNGIIVEHEEVNNINKDNVPEYTEETFKKIKRNAIKNSKFIESAIEKLIKSPSIGKKLGKNGYERVKKGKFSIKERNKKLRRIYEECLEHG